MHVACLVLAGIVGSSLSEPLVQLDPRIDLFAGSVAGTYHDVVRPFFIARLADMHVQG